MELAQAMNDLDMDENDLQMDNEWGFDFGAALRRAQAEAQQRNLFSPANLAKALNVIKNPPQIPKRIDLKVLADALKAAKSTDEGGIQDTVKRILGA